MLSDEVRARVDRQVKHFTDAWRTSKGVGYNVKGLSLLTFDSQEDFDLCRPEDKGTTNFQEHNEFIAEVTKGLIASGVPAEPVLMHFSDFSRWLNGKPITSEARSTYGAYLLAEAQKREDR